YQKISPPVLGRAEMDATAAVSGGFPARGGRCRNRGTRDNESVSVSEASADREALLQRTGRIPAGLFWSPGGPLYRRARLSRFLLSCVRAALGCDGGGLADSAAICRDSRASAERRMGRDRLHLCGRCAVLLLPRQDAISGPAVPDARRIQWRAVR